MPERPQRVLDCKRGSAALTNRSPQHLGRVKAELGDLLFSLVNVARLLEIDAEGSLRQAADTFTRRFKEVEAAMRAEGRQLEEASAEELDRQWLAVKSREGLARSGDES